MSQIANQGFEIIDNVFSNSELDAISTAIESSSRKGSLFRMNGGLFAIRQFLSVIPAVREQLFTSRLTALISEKIGSGYFVVKSIYFDKPSESNWFVSSHQDLTISVKTRHDVEGFGPWTVKENQYAVQPPVKLLEDNMTLRIHLDDADETNGALLVIPGSHSRGVISVKSYERPSTEVVCKVRAGSVMLMKPLLMHRSKRVQSGGRRRVIHIEFSRTQLPAPLEWSEL